MTKPIKSLTVLKIPGRAEFAVYAGDLHYRLIYKIDAMTRQYVTSYCDLEGKEIVLYSESVDGLKQKIRRHFRKTFN